MASRTNLRFVHAARIGKSAAYRAPEDSPVCAVGDVVESPGPRMSKNVQDAPGDFWHRRHMFIRLSGARSYSRWQLSWTDSTVLHCRAAPTMTGYRRCRSSRMFVWNLG